MRLHGAQPVVEATRLAKAARERGVASRRTIGGAGRIERRRRSALAEDLGGHTLRDLSDVATVAGKKKHSRLTLDVDEARRHDEARGVDALLGRRATEQAGRHDAHDAIAPYGD